MLNTRVREKLATLEKIIQKESSVPFVNRLLGDSASEKLMSTWMYKSWEELTHSDLVETGEALHYRRVLKKARVETLGEIEQFLDKNVYAEMIMDMVLQVYEEEVSMNRLDALYLMELALELARVDNDMPAQSTLLNMMNRNKEEHGSLSLLKLSERPKTRVKKQMLEEVQLMAANDPDSSEILPTTELESTLNDVAARLLKQSKLDVMRGDKSDLHPMSPPCIRGDMSDSQLFISEETPGEDGDLQAIDQMSQSGIRRGKESSSQNRLMLIERWEALEEDVRGKVSTMLNDSIRMKDLKKQLWERQQFAEQILDYTHQCCEDTQAKEKYHREMLKMRPIFRCEMGRKISARPEVAEKIYNILDEMMELEVSAFEYIKLAVALAKNPYDIAITIIECDILNGGGIYANVDDILETLSGFDERCQGLPQVAAKALSERQLHLWENGSG